MNRSSHRAPRAGATLAALGLVLGSCQCGDEGNLDVLVRVLTADATAVDVGAAFVGAQARTTVRLTSEGNAPVALATPVTDGPFTVSGVPGGIARGDSVDVDVIFDAVAVGPASGRVVLDSDADNAPLTLTLTAEALPPLDCDDDNDCTSDLFDPDDGSCRHVERAGDCDDGDACTDADRCSAGSCVGDRVACVDDIACTIDTCAPDRGCVFVPDDTACVDDDPCTLDVCETDGFGEGCAHPTAPDFTPCGDIEQCVTIDLCIAGFCSPFDIPDDAPCTDFNVCTGSDRCAAGACSGVPVEQPPVVVGESHVYDPLSPAHPWSALPPGGIALGGRTYLTGLALTETSPRFRVHHALGALTHPVAIDDSHFVAFQHPVVDADGDEDFNGAVDVVFVEFDDAGDPVVLTRAGIGGPLTLAPIVDDSVVAVCRDAGSVRRFALFDKFSLAPLSDGEDCGGAIGGGVAPSGVGITAHPEGAVVLLQGVRPGFSRAVLLPDGCAAVDFDGAFIAARCGDDTLLVPAFTSSTPLRLENTTSRALLRLDGGSLLLTSARYVEAHTITDDGTRVQATSESFGPASDPPPPPRAVVGVKTPTGVTVFALDPGVVGVHGCRGSLCFSAVQSPGVGAWVDGQALPDGRIFTHGPSALGVVDGEAGFDVVPATVAVPSDQPRVFRFGDDVVGVQPLFGDPARVGAEIFDGSVAICAPACPRDNEGIVRGSTIDGVDVSSGTTRPLVIARGDGDPDRSVLISPVLLGCEGAALDWRPNGAGTGTLFAVRLDGCDGADVALRVDVVGTIVEDIPESTAFTWRAALTDGTAIAYGTRTAGLVEVRFFDLDGGVGPVVALDGGTLDDLRHDGAHLVTLIRSADGRRHTLHAEGGGINVDYPLPSSFFDEGRPADQVRRRILAVAWPMIFVSDFSGLADFLDHDVIVFDAEGGAPQGIFRVPSEPVTAIVREDRGDVVVVRIDGTTTISPPCGRVPP